MSIYNEDTHGHSLWLHCWLQVAYLYFLLRTCVWEPSCTSASGILGAACDREPSAYRKSWCSMWAARKVRQKSCGCHTGWRAGYSAGRECSSGRLRFGSSGWRKRPAARCLYSDTAALGHIMHSIVAHLLSGHSSLDTFYVYTSL